LRKSTYTILSLKKASIRKSVTKCKTVCNLKPKEEKEELKSLSKGSKNKVGAQIRKFSGLVDNLRDLVEILHSSAKLKKQQLIALRNSTDYLEYCIK